MSELDRVLNETAKRLIKKYGYSKAEYNRQVEVKNGWKNEFKTETELVDIIVLPSSKYSRETFKIQGEKAMLDNNYIAYLPHTTFTPTINDNFKINDISYSVVSVVMIAPSGNSIIYKLELK